MHVFADFVDNFFGHFRPAIRYGTLPRGSRILTKCYQYIHLRSDTNFRPATQGASYILTKSATAKSLTNNAGPRPRYSSLKCGQRWCGAASIMRPLSRGRPRDNSAVHGASEDVPGMTYDVPGVSYPIPWTSGDCPQGVRPADGPGAHSLASTGPFSQAAVHRASGLLRFSQSQRGRIMDRKWGCPQYVRNRKLMSRSCPGNATATLLAALTFFVKNKLILL